MQWAERALGDVAHITLGQSPPSSTYNTTGDGLPFFQGKSEFGELFPTAVKWCTSPTKTAEAGDVLLSVRAPVGPTNLAPSRACIGRGLAALRGKNGVSSKYLLYALRAREHQLAARASGTTFPAITGNTLRSFRIRIAPEPEQSKIVLMVEELFGKLDAGIKSLNEAKALLANLRESVLAAATTGKLSRKWRAEHREMPSGKRCLEGILDERRRTATGKYREPPTCSSSTVPHEIPIEWEWATLEQLSDARRPITYGVIKLGKDAPGGVSTLRSSNVRRLRYELDGAKKISRSIADKYARTYLRGGEVLVTVRGTLGGVAAVPIEFAGFNISREVAMVAPLSGVQPECLAIFLGSKPIQDWLRRQAKGITYTGVNISSLKLTPVPLPPMAEQEHIVTEVKRLNSTVSELERVVEATLKQANGLRSSVLREAFSGKLFPTLEEAANTASSRQIGFEQQ